MQTTHTSGFQQTDQMLADSGFAKPIQQELSRNAWTQQSRIGGRFIDCLRSEINALRNLGLDDYRHAWESTRTWRSS